MSEIELNTHTHTHTHVERYTGTDTARMRYPKIVSDKAKDRYSQNGRERVRELEGQRDSLR